MLIMYDMIITGDDESEIAQLKAKMSKEFEVNDLGQLKCFFGIDVTYGEEGIALFQRKYMLDLFTETGILGCKHAVSPIDRKFKTSTEAVELVDHERYQRFVSRLIYLSHTCPDISFAGRVVWM
jgi:Reverse transcriptase (RNA-dependent DNA polymerase)